MFKNQPKGLIAANISTEQFVGMSGKAANWVGMAIAGYEWLAATTSCSSSSKAPRKPQTDMVEQVLPLSGPEYRSDMRVISNASCTTNCLAPLAYVI